MTIDAATQEEIDRLNPGVRPQNFPTHYRVMPFGTGSGIRTAEFARLPFILYRMEHA